MLKKIMVPLDGSELAECVLPHVEGFIESCRVGTIVFVRAIEPDPMSFRESYAIPEVDLEKIEAYTKKIEEERKSSAGKYLNDVVDRLRQEGIEYHTEVIVGEVADSLMDYSESNDVDLILIATHGRSGISRWVRGSIADRILRASQIPVLMVRAPETKSESTG
jgi:nucleotide-binding universal stress UspA family protein